MKFSPLVSVSAIIALIILGFGHLYIGFIKIPYPIVLALICVLSTLWFTVFPLKKHMPDNGFLQILYNLLLVEIVLLPFFAQHHPLIAVLLILLVAGACVGLHNLLQVKARQTRNPQLLHSARTVLSRFFVLVSFVLLLIPSILAIGAYEMEPPIHKPTETPAEEVAGETPEEQIAALTAEKQATLIQLKASGWAELSTEERLNALQTVVQLESLKLGIEMPQLISQQEVSDVIADYSYAENVIRFNLNHLDKPAEECVKTVCHECYHAYQQQLTSSVNWEQTVTQNAQELEAIRLWKNNMDDYKHYPSEEYATQPLEASAEAYANDAISAYTGYLSGQAPVGADPAPAE